MKIYLAEITAYNPSTSLEEIFYFSSSAMLPFEPTDADRPNQFYEPKLVEPANISRHIFTSGQISGKSQVNGGIVEVANADGTLDFLLDYGLDGRSIKVYIGETETAFSAFTNILDGIMEQPEFSWSSKSASRIRFNVRDSQADFIAKPMQITKFAGTNSGATGVEGLADDIEGQPKPLCYGECYNVSAVPVNTTSLIYQVHDGAVNSIAGVYDNGVAFIDDGDLASLASLQSATIAGGHFATCETLGLFRLGGSPAGTVTADVKGDSTSTYIDSVADVIERIVTTKGGLSSVDSTAFTALNTANGSGIGIYLNTEENIGNILDLLVNSIGAWWIFDRTNILTVGRLEAPSGTPVKSFTDGIDLLRIERQATTLPVYRINLEYKPVFTVQDGDGLAAGVTAARRAFLSKEYRKVTNTDTSVQTLHPLAPEKTVQTLLEDATEAATESARMLTLHKTQRQLYDITIPFTAENIAIDHGDVIEIKINRFGMSSGKSFVVIGVLPATPKRTNITLEVWG